MDVHNAFPAFQRLKMFTLSHDVRMRAWVREGSQARRTGGRTAPVERRFASSFTFASSALHCRSICSKRKIRDLNLENSVEIEMEEFQLRILKFRPRPDSASRNDNAIVTMGLSPYDHHNVIVTIRCRTLSITVSMA